MNWMLIAAVSLLTSLGQIAQKLAVSRSSGRAADLLRSPWIWAAGVCMGLGLLLWLLVLQRMDVGVAYPMLSLNFVVVTLAARYLLHEPGDGWHWGGIALIVLGVACIAS